MRTILKEILRWSEVWAPLIPLIFILKSKQIKTYLKPVSLYVWIALFLNTATDVLWRFKDDFGFHEGDFFWSNNFIYNTHSIIRLLLFSWFFILLRQRFMHRVKAILPFIFIAFAIVNFSFYENYFNVNHLSSRLLTIEAAILIFYCLQYFIYLLLEESGVPLRKQPGFWVVVGLSLYMSASFFIFLFYTYLIQQNVTFAVNIWDVHNVAYIIFCICLARAFYESTE
jgi:hypothetical protein